MSPITRQQNQKMTRLLKRQAPVVTLPRSPQLGNPDKAFGVIAIIRKDKRSIYRQVWRCIPRKHTYGHLSRRLCITLSSPLLQIINQVIPRYWLLGKRFHALRDTDGNIPVVRNSAQLRMSVVLFSTFQVSLTFGPRV